MNKIAEFFKKRHEGLLDAVVLVGCLLFICSYLPPKLLLLNTTPTGGDVPAHNYMVSHLKETVARGTIISWAGGWWGGFPMFQYYFFLPYLMMALLAFFIPINIAFKIVSVVGLYAMPFALYIGMRWMRVGRSAPAVMAAFSLPFMFVQTHTMWGVNVKSTLAGMISNSVSFCLFALFSRRGLP
ncbi:MAG: 6-pyruvoyl-tetrahydropterin synthase-related protein [Deltaproteobacteria bacterium]|nr:6-pyruvoyl-tetrahydropterin synthase-related protein [Deltaproteobacteria bacterium]